jgi:ubiquinone/menaquinone biosynthesis C-methylase UbiE
MRPDKDSFEAWNEAHAIKHDLDKFYNHPNRLFRFIENKRIKVLIDFADIRSSDLVLEVGCGIGNILEKIPRGRLTGIDISEVQIQRAKEKLGNKAELIKAPGEKIPFNDKHFDRIICTEVFEHTLEPEAVLNEMNRTLKDSGIVSLSVPNEKLIALAKKFLLNFGFRWVLEPKESKWDLASRNNLEEWHLHEYGLERIIKEVKHSFNILKISRIPFFFIPFRYVLKLEKIDRQDKFNNG